MTTAANQNNIAISEIEKEEHFPMTTAVTSHEKK
jgi:hypothetical protein